MTPEQVIQLPEEIRTADVEHPGSGKDALRQDSEGLKDQLRLKAEVR